MNVLQVTRFHAATASRNTASRRDTVTRSSSRIDDPNRRHRQYRRPAAATGRYPDPVMTLARRPRAVLVVLALALAAVVPAMPAARAVGDRHRPVGGDLLRSRGLVV